MKVKMTLGVALLLAATSLTAFAGVKFVKTWKNPEAQPVSWQGKKVAVFALTALVSNREAAEKALARELTQRGVQAVLGYTLVPEATEKDREAVKRILTNAGITGAVIMRVVDLQQETEANSGEVYYMGPNYASFWGYWDYGMLGYIGPTVKIKATVIIETLAYSVDQNLLLWAGTSQATNPDKADDLIKKLVGDAANQAKKAGLIKK